MGLSTIQSLGTESGLRELARSLRGVQSFYDEGPETIPDIKALIQSELEEDPRLKHIQVRATPGLHGAYFHKQDKIGLGVINPAVVAHELGHAKNLRDARVYSKFLGAANTLSGLNAAASLPVMLGIRAFLKDRDARNEALNLLTGVSAALAAPGLAEELSASLDAVKHAPDKLQAIKTLLPAFMTHVGVATVPLGIYQVGKHV